MDRSVRPANAGEMRLADALLRTQGGCRVLLRIPKGTTDGSDAAQLGMSRKGFEDLELAPAVFRRALPQTRSEEMEEVLLSASAVQKQVGSLQLPSANALFAMAVGVVAGGRFFSIDSVSASTANGSVYLYRLRLRAALSVGE